jgi:hypothetical protein
MISFALFIVVNLIGVVAYWLGRWRGENDGYQAGFVAGNNAAIDKSHPSVRVIRPVR